MLVATGVRIAALAAGAVFCAVAANAATLNEATVPGGAFGPSWNNLTTVAAGYDTITGSGGQDQQDNFLFTLPTGHQTLTFDFTAPADAGDYSAGGWVLYSTTPFQGDWDGVAAGQVDVNTFARRKDLTLDLPDFQGGSLYLALNFTYGSDLGYSISVPGNAAVAPAPIPLPAGAALLATGVVALLGFGVRRRPAAIA